MPIEHVRGCAVVTGAERSAATLYLRTVYRHFVVLCCWRNGERTLSALKPEGRRLLTVAEVAAILAVSKAWVYRKCQSGALPCLRIGSLLRFDKLRLEEWLSSR